MPNLTEFWMEWRFDSEMPEWSLENGEQQILEQMQRDGGMVQPVVDPGQFRGTIGPVEVRLLDAGRVMRVRFDMSDVAMPVYRGAGNPESEVDVMEQVTEGDLWRKGGDKTLWTVGDIAGGTALLYSRDKAGAAQEEPMPVTRLAAASAAWHRITVEGEMERYGIGKLAALRTIWSGEEEREAARNAEYFEGEHTFSSNVARSKHLAPVLEQYAPTLQPNEDALAFIVDQVLEREERDPTPMLREVGQGTEDEELARMRAADDVHMPDPDEAEQLVSELREFLGRGPNVADTIESLRQAREWLGQYLPPAVRELARLYPNVMKLLEAAEGQLDELHGPPFNAWYCGFCGNVVTDKQVDAVLNGNVGVQVLAGLGLREVRLASSPGDLHEGPLLICACHEEHGMEMRHVIARVTADSPALEPARA